MAYSTEAEEYNIMMQSSSGIVESSRCLCESCSHIVLYKFFEVPRKHIGSVNKNLGYTLLKPYAEARGILLDLGNSYDATVENYIMREYNHRLMGIVI